MTSTPTAATDTYGFGERIEVTVTFDREVTVTGTPRIQLRVGGGQPTNLKWADYDRGTGAVELVFVYVVVAGDSDDNGIYIEDDELELNSGTIQGVDDDVAAELGYDGPGQQDGHKVDATLNPSVAAPGAPTGLSATAAGQTAIRFELDGARRRRRGVRQRLPDRVVHRRGRELGRLSVRHRQRRHRLSAQRSDSGDHLSLPGVGHQLRGNGHRLEHRHGNHRNARSGGDDRDRSHHGGRRGHRHAGRHRGRPRSAL